MNKGDEAFLADWAAHSQFGAVSGTQGVDRQAATLVDGYQRKWLAGLLQAHGFTIQCDAIGNLFGLYELVPGAPYVLTGSHVDSQPTAGRFDGAYGVMASAHACIRLADEFRAQPEKAKYNLAVVAWFNEEGCRFKPSMMGSSVFVGKLPLEQALATTDLAGVSVREALDLIDERGDAEPLPVASYAEIHIEQGRSMEEDGIDIGLVHATWGAHKFELKVTGDQSHSGSTRMADRKDALLGAARLIVAARDVVDQFEPEQLHTAVGQIVVYPNSPVTVASEAEFHIDMRSPSAQVLREAYDYMSQAIQRVEQQVGVKIEITAEHKWDQQPYQEAGVALAREVAEALGLKHGQVMTIAGHDSTNMKDVVPSVMLFVPSVDGISHNLREYTKDEDLIKGLHQLTGVLRRMVMGALAQ